MLSPKVMCAAPVRQRFGAVCVLPSISVATAARRMQAAGVKRLPVEDSLGRLVGIVSRGDLLKAHLRSDAEIRRDVSDEVLWQHLALEPDKVRAATAEGVVTLSGRTRCRSTSERAVRLVSQVPGVVGVVDRLTYDIDDSPPPGARRTSTGLCAARCGTGAWTVGDV